MWFGAVNDQNKQCLFSKTKTNELVSGFMIAFWFWHQTLLHRKQEIDNSQ